MDRRSFLKTATVAGAASLVGSRILIPDSAEAAVNPNSFLSLANSNAMVAAEHFAGSITQSSYQNLSKVYANWASLWAGNNLDAIYKQHMSTITPSMLNATHTKPQEVTNRIRMWNPNVSDVSIPAYINWLGSPAVGIRGGIDLRVTVINNLRQNGMYPYLLKARDQSARIALMLAPRPPVLPDYPQPRPVVVRMAEKIPPNDAGGPTACQWDAMDSVFVGLAFLTLTVMTGGLFGIGAVIASEALAAIAIAGSAASGVWGVAHSMYCPL